MKNIYNTRGNILILLCFDVIIQRVERIKKLEKIISKTIIFFVVEFLIRFFRK